MSLPLECQTALDTLNEIGGRLKTAKTNNTDTTTIMAEFNAAKTALDNVIRPAAASAEPESTYYWDVIGPCLARVMTKPEKKKYDKGIKKRKKAAAAGTPAPTAPTSTATAAPTSSGDGTTGDAKKPSKKELKRLEKAKKKAAAKAKNAADKAATATSSSSSASTSRTASSGNERVTKSRKITSSNSNTTLTPPLTQPPRTPIAGTIDPARCTPSSLRQILAVAALNQQSVTLGRFQTNALFMDVPSYDVGDGTILSGSDSITEYLTSTAQAETTDIDGVMNAEWQAWCVLKLTPLFNILLPNTTKPIGVVFDSVVTIKLNKQKKKEALLTMMEIFNELQLNPPTTTTSKLMVALRLDDLNHSCNLDQTTNTALFTHSTMKWTHSVLNEYQKYISAADAMILNFQKSELNIFSKINTFGLKENGISSILSNVVAAVVSECYPALTITAKMANVTPGRTSDFQCGVANVVVALLKKSGK